MTLEHATAQELQQYAKRIGKPCANNQELAEILLSEYNKLETAYFKQKDKIDQLERELKLQVVHTPGKVQNMDKPSSFLGQVGGDHYKKLGDGKYQPYYVFKYWMTPDEYRGYFKGEAQAYIARERDKGGDVDIRKAIHALQFYLDNKPEVMFKAGPKLVPSDKAETMRKINIRLAEAEPMGIVKITKEELEALCQT